MKIGVDLSMLVYAGSGVATYTLNFAQELLKRQSSNNYVFFYSSLRKPKNFTYLNVLRDFGANIKELPLPTSAIRFLWNKHSLLPVEALIGKVDFYHSSDYLRPPLLPGTKGITTIHDLTWKLFPQYHTEDVIRHHERKLERTIKYQDIIIVDSQNTEHDLLKLYPMIDEKKVHIIYLGIDDRFQKVSDTKKIASVLSKYSIPNTKYLLYVGAIEPRKNLPVAINVYNELLKDKKYSDYHFVIAGRAGWKNESVYQLVKELNLEDRIHFIGFVEDIDLPTLYSGASVFIYLSLYEGFGLPPLEAAACGTPSLIYRNSSLAESFPNEYPFAEKGNELKTLINLIENPERIKLSFVTKYSWKNYVNNFLAVLSQFQSL